MPVTSFTAGTAIKSADVNSNFGLCVLTDTARTITVTHTWSASQTFSGGWTAGAACTISSGGIAVTGNSTITGTLGGVTTLTTSGAINGQTISSSASFTGTVTVATGLTVSAGGAAITGNSTVTGTFHVTSTSALDGLITAAAGIAITGGTPTSGQITKSATYGLNLYAVTGSTDDFAVFGAAGGYVLHVPTGTHDVTFAAGISATTGAFNNNIVISSAAGVSQLSYLSVKGTDAASAVKQYYIGVNAGSSTDGTLDIVNASNVGIHVSTTGGFSATTGAFSGDFAVATSKFTVAAASGNTVVAGTLTVSSNAKISTADAYFQGVSPTTGTVRDLIGVSSTNRVTINPAATLVVEIGGLVNLTSIGGISINNQGVIGLDASNDLQLSLAGQQLALHAPSTRTTIGANGAASALTANPVGYLDVAVGDGTTYQIPYYNRGA